MMGWYHDGGWGWGGWLLMTLSMALVWAAVAAAIVVLFRSEARSGGVERRPQDGGDPARILAERFARGEIDAEEYRTRADLLRTGGAGPVPTAAPER